MANIIDITPDDAQDKKVFIVMPDKTNEVSVEEREQIEKLRSEGHKVYESSPKMTITK